MRIVSYCIARTRKRRLRSVTEFYSLFAVLCALSLLSMLAELGRVVSLPLLVCEAQYL